MKTIKHTIFYSQPPQAVWEYLTKSELLAQWLMPNDFKPVVGHEFMFKTRPMPDHNFDGNIYCKVLEVEPHKKIVYTWKGGAANGQLNLDSVVNWTLTPKNGGTELQLEHNGFKDVDVFMFTAMDAGWLKNMKEVATLLNKSHATTQN